MSRIFADKPLMASCYRTIVPASLAVDTKDFLILELSSGISLVYFQQGLYDDFCFMIEKKLILVMSTPFIRTQCLKGPYSTSMLCWRHLLVGLCCRHYHENSDYKS